MTIRAGGTPLPWRRDPLDMYAVSVTVPAGATQLEIAIDSGLPTEGGMFSTGPMSTAQLAVLSWNQLVLLPKGRDAATFSTAASVLAPAGWQLNCALGLQPQADGSVRLEPASLARLIDSPLQMGRYAKRIELAGSAPLPQLAHAIAVVADSEAALTVPDDFGAGYGRLVAEAGALFGTRMYRHYTWLLSLSDHVEHFGLEHHESSDDRTAENSLSEAPLREGVAELLAHEYVHSWNGKYRRPAGLLSPDYQKPMDGSLLWVYEGMTQVLGHGAAGARRSHHPRQPPRDARQPRRLLRARERQPLAAAGRYRGGGADPVRRAGRLGGVAAQCRFLRRVRVPVAQRGHGAARP